MIRFSEAPASPGGTGPETWSGIGTTGAGGLLTINFPTPFTSTPSITATPLTGSDSLTDLHIHAVSTTAVTLHCRQAAAVVLLGIQILAFPSNAVGVQIHVHAIERGDFV